MTHKALVYAQQARANKQRCFITMQQLLRKLNPAHAINVYRKFQVDYPELSQVTMAEFWDLNIVQPAPEPPVTDHVYQERIYFNVEPQIFPATATPGDDPVFKKNWMMPFNIFSWLYQRLFRFKAHVNAPGLPRQFHDSVHFHRGMFQAPPRGYSIYNDFSQFSIRKLIANKGTFVEIKVLMFDGAHLCIAHFTRKVGQTFGLDDLGIIATDKSMYHVPSSAYVSPHHASNLFFMCTRPVGPERFAEKDLFQDFFQGKTNALVFSTGGFHIYDNKIPVVNSPTKLDRYRIAVPINKPVAEYIDGLMTVYDINHDRAPFGDGPIANSIFNTTSLFRFVGNLKITGRFKKAEKEDEKPVASEPEPKEKDPAPTPDPPKEDPPADNSQDSTPPSDDDQPPTPPSSETPTTAVANTLTQTLTSIREQQPETQPISESDKFSKLYQGKLTTLEKAHVTANNLITMYLVLMTPSMNTATALSFLRKHALWIPPRMTTTTHEFVSACLRFIRSLDRKGTLETEFTNKGWHLTHGPIFKHFPRVKNDQPSRPTTPVEEQSLFLDVIQPQMQPWSTATRRKPRKQKTENVKYTDSANFCDSDTETVVEFPARDYKGYDQPNQEQTTNITLSLLDVAVKQALTTTQPPSAAAAHVPEENKPEVSSGMKVSEC